VYNVEKGNLKAKRRQSGEDNAACPPKKSKNHTMYPALDEPESDEITYERHMTAMNQEMSKEKPRKEVVTELLTQTFVQRRNFVLNEAQTTMEILEKYPGLKISDMVCLLCMHAYVYRPVTLH
jgi:hypothetical protein